MVNLNKDSRIMNEHHKQLVKDNPNLSSSALMRLTGMSRAEVARERDAPLWKHSGIGIPFLSHSIGNRGLGYKLRVKNRTVVSCSSLDGALENLDRLIYCLENNEGKLPMTCKEFIYHDLRFIK